MDNLSKIRKFSAAFRSLLSVLLVVAPLYDVGYWALINHLPQTLITVNTQSRPLIPHHLTLGLQLAGFAVSLLPLSALMYGLVNIRKLFSSYTRGLIFSLDHVKYFKSTAKALIAWVVFSIFYESAKSVLFSIGNPPGQRILQVGLSSAQITTLIVGAVVFVVAWVMDEARILSEENELTV